MAAKPLSEAPITPIEAERDSPVSFKITFPSLRLLKQIAQTPDGHEGRIELFLATLLECQLLAPRSKEITVKRIRSRS